MKPFDAMMMLCSIVLALAAISVQLFSASDASSGMGVLLAGALGLFCKSVVSYFASMSFYSSVVLSSMNNRTLGNNRCSIQHLVSSVRAQEFKEAVIAYSAIVGAGKAMALAPSRVSAEASRIIDAFDPDRTVNPVHCILDTEDALKKLFDLKLARLDFNSNTAIAVPPAEAVKLLKEAISSVMCSFSGTGAECSGVSAMGAVPEKTTQ